MLACFGCSIEYQTSWADKDLCPMMIDGEAELVCPNCHPDVLQQYEVDQATCYTMPDGWVDPRPHSPEVMVRVADLLPSIGLMYNESIEEDPR